MRDSRTGVPGTGASQAAAAPSGVPSSAMTETAAAEPIDREALLGEARAIDRRGAEYEDKIDGLESDLQSALEIIDRRGDDRAREWLRINYPKFRSPENVGLEGMTRLAMPRFTLADVERAHEEWGCNCGPGALAAIAGLTLDEARAHIPGFDKRLYTNPSMMNAALRGIGKPWRKIGANWPVWGLVRVQWEGPWTAYGVPMAARYRHTHWIGAARGANSIGVFDINCMNNGTGWCDLDDWKRVIVPFLTIEQNNRASGGWHITHAIEVDAS